MNHRGNAYNTLLCALILCVSLSASVPTPQLRLTATAIDKTPLVQAGVGQPFTLQVHIQNAPSQTEPPHLDAVANAHITPSGFTLSMINGVVSRTYYYTATCNQAGSYTFGPARLTLNKQTVSSNPLALTCAAHQKNNLPPTRGAAKTFMRLSLDQKSIFVGQSVTSTLTFYTADTTAVLQNCSKPESLAQAGFTIKKIDEPTTGIETIQSVEYRYIRWCYQLIATKAGTLTLPAFSADYQIHHGGFFSFPKIQRVYSNTASLESFAVPANPGNASDFIGRLHEYQLIIEPSHTRAGQAALLKVIHRGIGDFEKIKAPDLGDLHHAKWYVSKQYQRRISQEPEMYEHTQEYVIQAVEPGTITLALPDFTYFDTQQKRYVTLHAAPVTLLISAAISHNPASEARAAAPETTQQKSVSIEPADALVREQHPLFIPWRWYWILLASVAAVWLALTFLTGRVTSWISYLMQPSAYTVARHTVSTLPPDSTHLITLYQTLLALYAHQSKQSLTDISVDAIDRYLARYNLDPETCRAWQEFFLGFSQTVYGARRQPPAHLQQRSLEWITLLERLSRRQR